MAISLGISQSTLTQHLMAAQRKIFDSLAPSSRRGR
ncbi:MAG: helix-turn-helix domain-containing protein [Thaumarchaeota archaeon]|nr:helix-turn-helix domain-containing protein [Nitrososphaerota archaeon]